MDANVQIVVNYMMYNMIGQKIVRSVQSVVKQEKTIMIGMNAIVQDVVKRKITRFMLKKGNFFAIIAKNYSRTSWIILTI